IHQERIYALRRPMNVIDQLTFRVRLEEIQFHARRRGCAAQLILDLLQCLRTVDLRLTPAQQVQVRTADDRDPHFLRLWSQDRNISTSSSSDSSAVESVAGGWASAGPAADTGAAGSTGSHGSAVSAIPDA